MLHRVKALKSKNEAEWRDNCKKAEKLIKEKETRTLTQKEDEFLCAFGFEYKKRNREKINEALYYLEKGYIDRRNAELNEELKKIKEEPLDCVFEPSDDGYHLPEVCKKCHNKRNEHLFINQSHSGKMDNHKVMLIGEKLINYDKLVQLALEKEKIK